MLLLEIYMIKIWHAGSMFGKWFFVLNDDFD